AIISPLPTVFSGFSTVKVQRNPAASEPNNNTPATPSPAPNTKKMTLQTTMIGTLAMSGPLSQRNTEEQVSASYYGPKRRLRQAVSFGLGRYADAVRASRAIVRVWSTSSLLWASDRYSFP